MTKKNANRSRKSTGKAANKSQKRSGAKSTDKSASRSNSRSNKSKTGKRSESTTVRSQRTGRSANHTNAKDARRSDELARSNPQAQPQLEPDVDPSKAYFVDIDENHDGQRVDNFLVTHLKGVPKAHIYRIIRKGEVRVNKGRVKQTTRLQSGDSIRIPPIRVSEQHDQAVDGARYEFLNKTVLFEDDALLVINKPSGMAVHAGSGIKVGVIEALRALRTDLKYLELVHRLDRETSGCLVLAKKSSALKTLHEDFKTNSLKNKRLDKRYLALVRGEWSLGKHRITKPLDTDARVHGERFVKVADNGSYASSIVWPRAVSGEGSLVEVKLLTGRTHQVRVHLLSENAPLAGDTKYGDAQYNKKLKSLGLSRLFLHASSLEFTHPVTQELVKVDAPLPLELTTCLAKLDLCIS